MDSKTVETYTQSAAAFARYFEGIGSRKEDIERGLELANISETSNARVIEIGCGDGRDAVEIVKRVSWYEGFDPSKGMIDLAREKLPGVSFVQADTDSYQYPKDIDVVYAFASLLHVPKDDLLPIFERVADSLRPNGIFYISLKEAPVYAELTKKDMFGERMFYYYPLNFIKELDAKDFISVYENRHRIGNTDWFVIALKKVP